MSSTSWGWVVAKATGTSHLRAGKGCDDFGGCTLLQIPDADVLILAVSDGAGSAEHSAIGARLTTLAFARRAAAFVKSGGDIASLSQQTALDWLDDVRDRIARAAGERGAAPRDFAATLVGCDVTPDHATFVHVGDGAGVIRLIATQPYSF